MKKNAQISSLRVDSRPMHARLFKLSEILRTQNIGSVEQLASLLEVSRKTAWKDVNHLLSLGHDIEFTRNVGWKYRNPPPELTLSSDELFAILVAHKAMTPYHGTPFEKPLLDTFNRLRGSDAPAWHCSWEALSQAITFKTTGICESDMAVYRQAVESVATSRELQIDYRGLKDIFAKRRTLRPFHLCCYGQTWYLIGHDTQANDIRTFAIPRITVAKVLKTSFKRPPTDEIRKLLDQSVGIHFEAKPQYVKIAFSREISRWVRERNWHPSQEIEELDDEKILLSMSVGLTPELEQWILSFGEYSQVREPKELVCRIKERVNAAIKGYKRPKSK